MKGVVVLGILALPLLMAFDYAIVSAAFLGEPRGGEWVLAAAAAMLIAAFALCRGWLIFAAQNLLLSAAVANALAGGPPPDAGDLVQFLGLFGISNLLTWPLARLAGRWLTSRNARS